jgi:hypothetical protein
LDTAIRRFDRSLDILRAAADSHTLASVMANSVSPHLAANNLDAAGKRLLECIELSLRDGYPRVLAHYRTAAPMTVITPACVNS